MQIVKCEHSKCAAWDFTGQEESVLFWAAWCSSGPIWLWDFGTVSASMTAKTLVILVMKAQQWEYCHFYAPAFWTGTMEVE